MRGGKREKDKIKMHIIKGKKETNNTLDDCHLHNKEVAEKVQDKGTFSNLLYEANITMKQKLDRNITEKTTTHQYLL